MRQGIKHTIKKKSTYFLTLTVVGWIDVFTRKNHKDLIIQSLRYCIQNKGLNVYSYCLMTNHLHLIVNTNHPHELRDTIRDFKRHTTKQLITQIKNEPESRREWMLDIFEMAGKANARSKTYKFWKTSNHAIELINEDFTWSKINYIHNNPVKEQYVSKAEDLLYSSATNYHELDALLPEVHCISSMLKNV